MSMNSYCTVIQKAVLIRRNSQFPPSIIPLRSKRLWTLQRRWICHSMNLQSVKQRLQVIMDVSTMKSEIGVLYLSDFNRKSMEKLLNSANLEFHPLIECDAYVYLWKGHPLAKEACITMKQLENYPCLAFEQGDNSSFYLSEELLPTNEYSQIIHANDRATMLNLMVGLNGYTLCSGLICEDLNGNDYRAVPFKNSEGPEENKMEVGYVTRKNLILSKLGEMYVNALKEYLKTE